MAYGRWLASACVALLLSGAAGAAEDELVGAWEAEELKDIVGAVPEATYAKDASQGKYVYLDDSTKTPLDGLADYVAVAVDAPAGAYLLRVRALGPSTGADSFWVIVDDSAPQSVSPPANKQWTWQEVNIRLFSAGPHRILIAAREPTRVDRIELRRTIVRPVLHQVPLVEPEPDGRRPVFVNPPTLRWPRFAEAPFTVELSRSERMTQPLRFSGISESFYRPLQPLEPGQWWWRVSSSKPAASLGPVSFAIGADVARWPVPSWEESLARVPKAHPRLYFRPQDLPRLREYCMGPLQDRLAAWTREAERAIGAELPKPAEGTDASDSRTRTMQRTDSKNYASRVAGPIENLALCYLLTGRKEFADEARRRALFAASLDPKGFTSHQVSDFANGTIALNCALAYDYLYDFLSQADKAAIRQAILERCRIGFASYMPSREQSLFSAHGWQHVIQDLTAGALALYDESPEAKQWFDWSFKMHVALYPWYGEGDGGSAEGASYYAGTNMLTSLRAARLFEAATGVDITQGPWFQNNPYFLIYSHPPGFQRSEFGDCSILAGPPGGSQKLAALLHAAKTRNPYSRAYHDAIAAGLPVGIHGHLQLFWWPLDVPEPRPLSELPKARAFYDIGVVYMHSAIAEPENNLMFEFRSSPYGSYNHAHADQNSFNLIAYGEPLIIDSGYYTSYGDEHHYGYTIHTMAHNTVLVDGKGQAPRNLDAFGQLTHFEQDDKRVYLVGSCPNAYHETQLDRFDRHVLWIQPDTYVIYDILEAPQAHTFQWLLHAQTKMEVDSAGRTIRISGDKAEAKVTLFIPERLNFKQTDQFAVPPEAWRPDRKNAKYPNQWHLTAETTAPSKSARFLAVIQPCRKGALSQLPGVELEIVREKMAVRLSDGRTGEIPLRLAKAAPGSGQ